ncbi:MAG: hypothetical protein CM1200mP18_13860 [Gammaproteobacteria bacterium]|nr:MAG: hypothetical protein CM1200mP18_13860 [Gammaproteobacteria bacterium]
MLPGIVASLLLTFTISFDEFIMAFFLGSTDPTLPVLCGTSYAFPSYYLAFWLSEPVSLSRVYLLSCWRSGFADAIPLIRKLENDHWMMHLSR